MTAFLNHSFPLSKANGYKTNHNRQKIYKESKPTPLSYKNKNKKLINFPSISSGLFLSLSS
jgi:hypothetical protein